MDPEVIAPAILTLVLILTVAGVVLLRPLAKHLGLLLEAMAREKAGGAPKLDTQLSQIRDMLQTQGDRLALMEERIEFTEALVRRRDPAALPGVQGPEESAGEA
ncbi:MAG: hypothetical protein ABFS34_07710 [Gemmatimonadota bacterium]